MGIFLKRYEQFKNMYLRISVVQQCGVAIMKAMKSQNVVKKNAVSNITILRRINHVN